jgi:hypothetical protein
LSIVLINEPKQKKEGKQQKRSDFIDVVIKLSKSELLVEFDLNVSIYDSIEDRKILKQFLINLLLPDEINDKPVIGDTFENSVKGSYFIANRYFQKEIFLDMIMNEKSFSELYVDERFKVSKQQTRLYIYFTNVTTGVVAFSLLNQVILTENDPLLILSKTHNKDNGIVGSGIKIGTQYIKVRISSIDNKSKILFFQESMNRIFLKYYEKLDKILKFYNSYIRLNPGGLGIDNRFLEFQEYSGQKKKQKFNNVDTPQIETLATIVPELFLPLYSRKCAKAPRIVLEPESLALRDEGFQTITFPLNGEGNLQPRIYSCDKHTTHPYPGLRANTLSNSDTFKFLPCCYATNQENRRGSPYGNYYKGEILTKDMTDHELYKTPRVVPDKIFGTLPSSIAKIFNSVSSDNYYRYGTRYGPNSFIDAVARATGDLKFENSSEERKQYINEIRKTMTTNSYIGVSRQETFDIDLKTVKTWLKSDKYFDPKRFLKIVEDYYNVTIFLFERNIGRVTVKRVDNDVEINVEQIGEAIQRYGSGGQMTIPTHSEIGPYILRPVRDKVIFIYIHMGSDVDKILYPQCETIVKYTKPKGEPVRGKKGVITGIFNSYDKEVKVIKILFEKLILKYKTPTTVLNEHDINFNEETLKDLNGLTITEQFIDESGKTRLLYASWLPPDKTFKVPPPFFTIVTEPIHPLRLPVKKHKNGQHLCIPFTSYDLSAQISPMTKKLVHIFMTTYNLNYHKASFKDYLCNASDYLKGTINGIKIRIYVRENTEENQEPQNVRRLESTLLKYNDARRIARIFFEYVLHKFSSKIKKTSTPEARILKIEKFINDECSIQNGFNYILPELTLGVPFFKAFDNAFNNTENKIIFSSKDLFIRVMYNVNQLIKQKWSNIEELQEKTIMDTYFENISDFKKGDFFIIHGLNNFMLLLSGTKQGELQLNFLEPFEGPRFFSSDDIEDGRVFSAFCFGNVDDAISTQINDPDTNKNVPGIIHIFDVVNGYESFEIKEKNMNGIKLVAFKVDDGTYYLTLKGLVS